MCQRSDDARREDALYDSLGSIERRLNKERTKCEKLEKIISSYHIQFKAAMRATSLGLCKSIIKHALEDEQKIVEK